jgi:ATP-dependent DNA helicase RecQ
MREVLRRCWGYESFRPLQESIVKSLLDGRDTCVVMPTGGGKSLCYQLPAAMRPGETAIVISPLIALMQDQAAHLEQIGIPAAVLNSMLTERQQQDVMRRAAAGEYRLLYLSPERLARQDTVRWLQVLPVLLFAIDEAHCISEWGHEFRPEYRRMKMLRERFPGVPIAAFTASATRQVRHDIIEQLGLRNPDKYIASFYRPNLRYLVRETDARTQFDLLLAALRRHEGASVIVYAPTIKGVEQTVDKLEERGIRAVAYHGQMDATTRRRNQERWMSDEARVLVGTIAFGLGINKPAVRAVIHLSLPKSIEQYYQEAGRAGRDGVAADCLLLWQKRDAGLLAHFIGQISDRQETDRAWQRYHRIREFVESRVCRHRQICEHFGETRKWKPCAACDVCGCGAEWLEAAADAAPLRRRKGKTKRSSPASPARRGGNRAHPVAGAKLEVNADLREYLREWRRAAAQERGQPAFVVMHDSSLDELCHKRPRSMAELRGVCGFGEKKTAMYGQEILDALARFERGDRATNDHS